MIRDDSGELRGRVKDLRTSLERAGNRLDPGLRARVEHVIVGAEERLDLGVDHTVVALVGGTGSGKSSMFNAVSGLSFAEVSPRRPTTSTLASCAWSHDAGRLLDWLGVGDERRIDRVSELDGDSQESLEGLVLLDLPDYDSVASEHRDVVNRVLPMVDLLVWVVDPQKYADDALHSGYLKELVGSEASMLVVLNQIDTVMDSRREELLTDVGRLLIDDGLSGVDVVSASARTDEGVGRLRERLAKIVARRSVAAARVAGELSLAGQALATALSADVPRNTDNHSSDAVEGLERVTGLPALSEGQAAGGGEELMVAASPLTASNLDPVRSAWLTGVGQALTQPWREDLASRIPDADALAAEVNASLAKVRVPRGSGRAAQVLGVLTIILGASAVALALLTILGGLGEFMLTPVFGSGLVAALVAAAVGCWLARRAARSREVTRRRDLFHERGSEQLRMVVDSQLRTPTQPLLDDHHDGRVLALAAVDSIADVEQAGEANPSEERPMADPLTTADDEGSPSTD